jgi:hypothetical protein
MGMDVKCQRTKEEDGEGTDTTFTPFWKSRAVNNEIEPGCNYSIFQVLPQIWKILEAI